MDVWQNLGDINPTSGTYLVRGREIDSRGDFRAECITVTPESDVGGDDRVFLLRQGDLFLSRKNMGSALEVIGAKLDRDRIEMPDHHGKVASIPLRSPEGQQVLADAARAYSGIDCLEVESLVRVGLPTRYDQSPKFRGEITVFSEASDFWAILRHQLDGVDAIEGVEIGAAEMIDTEEGPYAGLPREIRDRADLLAMPVFSQLGADDEGNPEVWLMKYRHEDCPSGDAPEWEMTHSCGCADDCPGCEAEIEPYSTEWIGPDQPDLIALWESLEDHNAKTRAPELDQSSEISF